MQIQSIAGFAVISKEPDASRTLYRDIFALPLKSVDDYLYTDRLDGAKHFGIWPLREAARSCFGRDTWPDDLPEPQTTIEFELGNIESVDAAVREMKDSGYTFVHEARLEPWGQTIARFMSPEGVLVGLSYAPWLHDA